MSARVSFIIIAAAVVAGCGKRPAEPAPVAEATPMNSSVPTTQPSSRFTGILRGGILAIGSETTGWVLETQPGKRVDLEVSKVADTAPSLEGRPVVVHGTMTTTTWVERGEKPLLIADRIEPASAAE